MTDGDLTDEELYGKLADRLVRFASTIVGPADAHDVMTDGVLAAFESAKWATVEQRTAYLYRCVLNAGRMHLRASERRRRRERRSTDVHPDDRTRAGVVPEPAPEVRRAVAGLSARQRAVVYLTYWEDLDERAVADRLRISVGSVRRHLHRARANVGKELHATL